MTRPFAFLPLLLITAVAASGCAAKQARFIEPTTLELGHAPGPRSQELGEDGYLQVQACNPSWFGMGTEMTTACPLSPDYQPTGH